MKRAMTAAKFVTVSELSERWNVPKQTLWHRCEQGRIPAMKVGRAWRIPVAWVEGEEATAFVPVDEAASS